MRNPYERAISHWRHIKGKNQNVPSFSAILRKAEIYFHPDTCYNSPESAIANTVIGSSCYATILERYLKYFDYSNIHCVAFEELINSPNIVLRQILNFLGADFQGVNSMLDGNKFPLRNDAGKQGRELVAKPILTQSDNSILIKLLHTQAAQALMVLGKTIDFWPQPR